MFETDTDRATFLTADMGGVVATWNSTSVNGLLDNDYVEVSGIEGTHPIFTCRTSDISGMAHGDTITISTVNYTVKAIQPDGTGITLLILDES